MGRNVFIDKSIPINEIWIEKRKIKREWAYFEKLTFIEDVYAGETVKYAIEKRGKSTQTGHNWIAKWNESGFEGLKRKPGSGAKSKLSDEEFIELKQLIKENNLTGNRQIIKLIKDKYGVNYSERQISRIMRNLKFGYAKPYIIPAKSPEDATDQLKKKLKKANVSLNRDIIGFLDQTGIQNRDNSNREYYDLADKHNKKEPTERIKINGNGFQMVNGNSLSLCQPNTRTFEFIKSLIQLRIINCADIDIKEELEKILHDKELDEKTIINDLNEKFKDVDIEKELVNLIDSSNVSKTKLLSKIKIKVDSLNPNKKQNIEEIQKNLIVEKLKTSEIIDKLKNQARIVLIADNYTVHRANLVKEACCYLNIEIVLLPVNSPHLNPIEQVWKSIKKFLSHYYLDDQTEMENLFLSEFYRIIDNNSFYNKWLYDFIDDFDYNSICYQLSDFKKCVLPIKAK